MAMTPLRPNQDDLANRAPGATVHLHAATPDELQRAQDRAFASVTAAVFAFCAFPGPQEMDRVKAVLWAYQVAWMQGRERPKPAAETPAQPLKVGDEVMRGAGYYLGTITRIDGPLAKTSNGAIVPLSELKRWGS